MKLVTLEEVKDRLSIDFNTKDNELTLLANSTEGYLYLATGFDFSTLKDSEDYGNECMYEVAKDWVLLKCYLDYYNAHTELDDLRLTNKMKQLQVYAAVT